MSGEGAKLYGGRWNSPGIPVVYTASSLSLAALEVMVNCSDWTLLEDYSFIELEFDDSLIYEPKSLPAGWNNNPVPASCTVLGDSWVRKKLSAVLKVPSAVVTLEYNYVINPLHPDFGKIVMKPAKTFDFDVRLKRHLKIKNAREKAIQRLTRKS
jgi:RES domain-containing protein